jgi:hypothetical protein
MLAPRAAGTEQEGHVFILRERSDRRTFSAEIEPFSGKILRFAQDEVAPTE